MTVIRHFELPQPALDYPAPAGWIKEWHEYYRKAETQAEVIATQHENTIETDCFLSILANIDKKNITVMEIGAGWGRWCLAAAGVIDHKVFNTPAQSYKCIAVEASAKYFNLTIEHLQKQKIKSDIFYGAVTNKVAHQLFNIDNTPFSSGLTFKGYIKNSRLLAIAWGIYHILTGKTRLVPTFTIDWLIDTHKYSHIDILQMDIQGEEYNALLGASHSIMTNKIDYLIIGTHHKNINAEIEKLLSFKYSLLLNKLPNTNECPHDGLQVFKRNDI
jgi:FkbM family methyltransferase